MPKKHMNVSSHSYNNIITRLASFFYNVYWIKKEKPPPKSALKRGDNATELINIEMPIIKLDKPEDALLFVGDYR